MKHREKFTFFWGGIFSNFHPAIFTDSEGITYLCTEQYYMAKKALYFKDDYRYKKIMESTNPYTQKKHGRKVDNFDSNLWYGGDNPAKKYMFEANYLKYSQNKKLKKILLDTEGTTLVETSPYDKIWGIGMQACALANYRKFWKGTNWLGEVLTDVREKLIEEESKSYLW